MGTAALIVSVLAVVVAAFGVAVAYSQGKKNADAIDREKGNRERELGLLQEQVDLVKRQTQEQSAAMSNERRAWITATRGPLGSAEHRLEWQFTLHNGGRATARNPKAWIERTPNSPVTWTTENLPPIQPRGQVEINLEQSAQGPADQQAYLAVSWDDEDGCHTERLLDVAVRP